MYLRDFVVVDGGVGLLLQQLMDNGLGYRATGHGWSPGGVWKIRFGHYGFGKGHDHRRCGDVGSGSFAVRKRSQYQITQQCIARHGQDPEGRWWIVWQYVRWLSGLVSILAILHQVPRSNSAGIAVQRIRNFVGQILEGPRRVYPKLRISRHTAKSLVAV